MPSMSVRTDLEPGGRIGPGKITLLEAIDTQGLISAEGRAMGVSDRRAWEFVEVTNGIFGGAVAGCQIGGRNGCGATLTPLGHDLVRRFRGVERAAVDAAWTHLDALQAAVVEAVTAPELGA